MSLILLSQNPDVTISHDFSYNITVPVTEDHDFSYNITVPITGNHDFSYNILGYLTSSHDFSYNILGYLTSSHDFSYNILDKFVDGNAGHEFISKPRAKEFGPSGTSSNSVKDSIRIN